MIYKIFRTAEWQELFKATGKTLGAPVDLKDGYIHFSTAEQVARNRRKHFADEDDLMLGASTPTSWATRLRWEPSRGGALFPHLYRSLRLSDALWHAPLPLGPDGHDFPDEALA